MQDLLYRSTANTDVVERMLLHDMQMQLGKPQLADGSSHPETQVVGRSIFSMENEDGVQYLKTQVGH